MFYGSNLYRKDNPRWVISNATETPKVPDAAFRLLPAVSDPWDRLVAGLGGGVVAACHPAGCDACGIVRRLAHRPAAPGRGKAARDE